MEHLGSIRISITLKNHIKSYRFPSKLMFFFSDFSGANVSCHVRLSGLKVKLETLIGLTYGSVLPNHPHPSKVPVGEITVQFCYKWTNAAKKVGFEKSKSNLMLILWMVDVYCT